MASMTLERVPDQLLDALQSNAQGQRVLDTQETNGCISSSARPGPRLAIAPSPSATGPPTPLHLRRPERGRADAMHKVLADGCNCPSTYSDARPEHGAERRFIARSARARDNSTLF